jgi:DNA-binding PadR family transcriptional regulator
MAVVSTLLGLLEDRPRHGYDLKRRYDRLFGDRRPLKFGQVYATLARLHRDGLIKLAAIERGEGPERKRYTITAEGTADVDRFLEGAIDPKLMLDDELFVKVVLALTSGRDAERLLDEQRAAHLRRMRELTRTKREGSLMEGIAADRELFHLEADLRWIELTSARLDRLRKELPDD